MSFQDRIAAAKSRAVGGHIERARDYATGRFVALDQAAGEGETRGRLDFGGMLERVYASHAAAVDFALETLERMSPVDTGEYKSSHMVLVNGQPVEWPVRLSPRDVVMIVNPQPYARRLERAWSDQAPDGVYEAASAIVAARTNAFVEFNYVGMEIGRHVPPKRGNWSELRYPALIIKRAT